MNPEAIPRHHEIWGAASSWRGLILLGIPYLVGGIPTPLKNISPLGWLFPVYGKIKNVPNHQPAYSQLQPFVWMLHLSKYRLVCIPLSVTAHITNATGKINGDAITQQEFHVEHMWIGRNMWDRVPRYSLMSTLASAIKQFSPNKRPSTMCLKRTSICHCS